MWVQFACYWRPLGYNLHVTGGHSGPIYMRLAASRMQIAVDFIHIACDWRPHGSVALAASCVQSCIASTLREQLFELKNEDAI
jgi:hypothetical protein